MWWSDGYCNVCTGWARFQERHRMPSPFALVPMQSEAGRALLVTHGIDPEDPTTFLVLDRGQVFTESAAAIHVVAALGGGWKLASIARAIPRPWRDGLYRVLARNRYRWFGRRTTCHLPGSLA